jgi:two-component system, LytTR family, sensor kinase
MPDKEPGHSKRQYPPFRLTMLCLFVLLTAGSLLSAGITRLDQLASGSALPYWYSLLWEFTGFYSTLAVMALVYWFLRRFPIRREKLWFWIPFHIVASFGFSAVNTTIFYGLRRWFYDILGLGEYHYGILFYRYLFEFQKFMMLYWMFYGGILLYQYVMTNREREVMRAKLEAELNQARLDVLKTQINPHFLFNTLNTISSFMYENVKAADRMISLLSQMLRQTLERSDRQMVPLSEDIELLGLYLAIMKARFEEKLSVRIDVPEECAQALVPSFLLQPIVENSVKFNRPTGKRVAEVVIRAKRRGPGLYLIVSDNGPGLNQEFQPGTGLANVRKRLDHLYGPDYLLEFANQPEGGLSVTIRLPYSPAPETENAQPGLERRHA